MTLTSRFAQVESSTASAPSQRVSGPAPDMSKFTSRKISYLRREYYSMAARYRSTKSEENLDFLVDDAYVPLDNPSLVNWFNETDAG
jgi:hypothetical protein